jgi:hypothetical protein
VVAIIALACVVVVFACCKLTLLIGAVSLHLKGKLEKASAVIALAIGSEAILQLALIIALAVWYFA